MSEHAVDATDLEDRVRTILCAALNLDPSVVGITTDLRTLGIESMQFLRVVSTIERTFNIELADEDVFRVRTVRDVAGAVEAARTRGGVA